jgi:hypothetical protein
LPAVGFPEKVLKRSMLYVVIEKEHLRQISKETQETGNIQNRIIGGIFSLLKNESVNL